MGKSVITETDIRKRIREGHKNIYVPQNAIISPLARDLIKENRMKIIYGDPFRLSQAGISSIPFEAGCHLVQTYLKTMLFSELLNTLSSRNVINIKGLRCCETHIPLLSAVSTVLSGTDRLFYPDRSFLPSAALENGTNEYLMKVIHAFRENTALPDANSGKGYRYLLPDAVSGKPPEPGSPLDGEQYSEKAVGISVVDLESLPWKSLKQYLTGLSGELPVITIFDSENRYLLQAAETEILSLHIPFSYADFFNPLGLYISLYSICEKMRYRPLPIILLRKSDARQDCFNGKKAPADPLTRLYQEIKNHPDYSTALLNTYEHAAIRIFKSAAVSLTKNLSV